MKSSRIILVSGICLVFVFCGCGRTAKSAEDSSFSTPAKLNASKAYSVYFTRSPTMQTREKELSNCLFEAARQISMRKEVHVRLEVSSDKSADGSITKKTRVELEYDQTNSIAILEKLKVLSVIQSSEGTEAQIQYNRNERSENPSFTLEMESLSEGKPSWIDNPPEGRNFYAAVGTISQVSKKYEAFSNSDTNAIGILAQQVTEPEISGNLQVFDTVMHGVFIASRWYDQNENRYYSLAILPR